jgi:hypothetical protein
VVEAVPAAAKPVAQDVVAGERLQKLELRVASVQAEAHREVGRLAAHVQAVQVPRAVLDDEPLVVAEERAVALDRRLDVRDDDPDLRRAAAKDPFSSHVESKG